MKDSSGICSDLSHIATKFNNLCANIGPSLPSKVPSSQFSYKDFLVGHYAGSLSKSYYSCWVASIVHSLKIRKCRGVEGLSISQQSSN